MALFFDRPVDLSVSFGDLRGGREGGVLEAAALAGLRPALRYVIGTGPRR